MRSGRSRAGVCVLCALFIVSVAGGSAHASSSDDEWTGTDKAKHFAVSFAVSTLAYNFYLKNTEWSDNSSKTAAFVTTMAVGAAKEFMDDEFSWKDMGADAAGAGLGIAVAIEF